MEHDAQLREQLVALLQSEQAHVNLDRAVEGFPAAKAGIRPEGSPHSAWELLEHMRIAQEDILRFSISPDYKTLEWPDAYWPASPKPASARSWTRSLKAFREDLARFERLVQDPKRDLHERFPWGTGQTLLREALLLADHNAYHLGQLMMVRRLLGEWKASQAPS